MMAYAAKILRNESYVVWRLSISNGINSMYFDDKSNNNAVVPFSKEITNVRLARQ